MRGNYWLGTCADLIILGVTIPTLAEVVVQDTKQTGASGNVAEFMHEVVAERERRLGSSNSHLSMFIRRNYENMIRDMERTTQRLSSSSDPLINIEGSIYIRQSSMVRMTDMLRHNISRHAQSFDSSEYINADDHTHFWVLDYVTQGNGISGLYHYTCADCGRQVQASGWVV